MSSAYKLIQTQTALKQLSKLDRGSGKYIVKYIEKNLKNSTSPRLHDKARVGNKKGYWRYRIGYYRLICEIKDDELLIVAVTIGHGKDVYS